MKIFRKPDGGIIQIVGKERIQKWDAEQPLLFIGWVRDNILSKYDDPRVKKAIEEYLNEITEEVAIPKLVNTLKSGPVEARVKTAQRLEEISKGPGGPDLVKTALEYVKELAQDEVPEVAKAASNVLKNVDKAEKKKTYSAKRKQMTQLDKKLAKGEVTDEEYMQLRKEYLHLEEEVGAEEE
ncbi:MAG TPA: hypothetical protein VKK79_02980 [Candidatus Lokiarchaeia archaeon]|nr:hypothetical protein [Candidatus Lokiarchaeia archaeon]